ncbi:MAG: DUF1565 domain-containing protein, partial [Dolichospermum sp.]
YDNLAGFPTEGSANNLYYDSTTGKMYYWNGTSYVAWGGEPLKVILTTQPTPTATGNTTNKNSVFKDSNGDTWIVDDDGNAILTGGTIPATFKELNQWHVDPNGNNTTGTGADEKPYLTITKALQTATQADVVIVNEGTYSEDITIATQNLTLRGQGQEYGGLTEIKSILVNANGTSVRVSSLTIQTTLTHTGTSPLYLADATVTGNYTSSTAAYTEIKNSRLQDGTISKTAAGGILFIVDSLIGNATFSTPNTAISLRNVTIDADKKVTIGAGVFYSLQDVVGDVEINAGAIPVETALLGQGFTAEKAKAGQTSNFNMIRLLDADTQNSPTSIVSINNTTKRLELSPLSSVSGDKYSTTSTTCHNISTASGDITFTVATGLAYVPLQTIVMIDASNSANHMHGDIVSY